VIRIAMLRIGQVPRMIYSYTLNVYKNCSLSIRLFEIKVSGKENKEKETK